MKVRSWSALILVTLVSIASAATLEKPVRTRFKDAPLDKNPISGYVQFGQLADGSSAIQKVNPTTARFYERQVLFAPSGIGDFYAANEINCKTGMIQVLGMGPIERITVLDDPPAAYPVRRDHPKNLPVYREVCLSAGLHPSW